MILPKKQAVFYLVAGLAVLLNEFALETGLYVFLSLPLALGVVAVGIWAFRKEKPSGWAGFRLMPNSLILHQTRISN